MQKKNDRRVFSCAELGSADLIVDACYEGGRHGNAKDDPLSPLLGTSNQGGFRYLGEKENPTMIVLTSTLADPDCPTHWTSRSGDLPISETISVREATFTKPEGSEISCSGIYSTRCI